MIALLLLTGCLPELAEWTAFSIDGEVEVPERERTEITTDRLTVGLVAMDITAFPTGFGPVLGSTEISGLQSADTAFEFHVSDAPPDESLHYIWPDTAPEAEAGLYLLIAWDERDDVPGPSDGDSLVGVAPQIIGYLRGRIETSLYAAGAEEGWNLFDLDLHGGFGALTSAVPFAGDLNGFPLSANLLPHQPSTLTGRVEWGGSRPDGTVRVWMLTAAECVGLDPYTVYAQTTVKGDDTFTFDGSLSEPGDAWLVTAGRDCVGSDSYIDISFAPFGIWALSETNEYWSSLTGDDAVAPIYGRAEGPGAALYPLYGWPGMGWQLLEESASSGGAPTFRDWDEGLVLYPFDIP